MAAPQPHSIDSQIAAQLASGVRNAELRLLTADNTVRRFVLSPGGWHLHGVATATYYTTRAATDAAGTLHADESVAPTTAFLATPAAGSPGAALAFPAAGVGTAPQLPLSTEDFVRIAVKGGAYQVLYVICPTGTTTPRLEGPFE